MRDWPKQQRFTVADAVTGVACFGGTGSGKTSGVAKHLAIDYMESGFGGLVLCSKVEERQLWQRWAQDAERSADLIVFDASDNHRFDMVHLLSEIATAVAKASGEPVTLPRLRELAASAPRRLTDLENPEWRGHSACARLLARLAEEEPRADAERRADLDEVFSYWTSDYPGLSERTRGISDMMFSMMVQPFL